MDGEIQGSSATRDWDIATLLLGMFSPIPSLEIWSKGNFTIYGSFLLLGSFCYVKETKQAGFGLLLAFTFMALFHCYYLTSIYQPIWIGSHSAALALLIFMVSWRCRESLIVMGEGKKNEKSRFVLSVFIVGYFSS